MTLLHKLKSIAFVLSGVMLASSCQKTLEVLPYTSFSDATAFSSPARVEAAINGVYDAAQSGFYAGGLVRNYPFGAANIQQGDVRGEDVLNEALFYQITYEATYNPTTANQQFMFETLYGLINKANLSIEGVEGAAAGGVITEAQASQYIGELRFLRAMAHHELLIHFARPYSDGNGSKLGIVYRETGVNSSEETEAAKAAPRTTVADNYARLLADLDFAEANLPAAANTFRATRGAAIALKMRVKLHKEDWAGVISEGNKLAPQATAPFSSPIGNYSLTTNPGDPFVLPGTTAESIFSIRNSATDNGGNNGGLANMYGSPANSARGLIRISPVIFNNPGWLCDDKRRSLLVTYTAAGKTNYLTTKYKDVATLSDPAPQIRYAEVLLTLAEAEARQAAAVSPRAVELLNAVRNRALASPATQAYTLAAFPAKEDLIRAIILERRIELLGEGKRWGDIHRLAPAGIYGPNGIPAKVGTGTATTANYQCGAGSSVYTTAVTAIPYSDYRFIWPIPLSETQQNTSFEQNPGY